MIPSPIIIKKEEIEGVDNLESNFQPMGFHNCILVVYNKAFVKSQQCPPSFNASINVTTSVPGHRYFGAFWFSRYFRNFRNSWANLFADV